MLKTLEITGIWRDFGGSAIAIVDLDVAGSNPVGHPQVKRRKSWRLRRFSFLMGQGRLTPSTP
jgi:hypothetical protein